MSEVAGQEDGAIVRHPYDEFDARRLAVEVGVQRECYARKKQEYEFLKRMLPAWVAKMVIEKRKSNPSLSKADAKDEVHASPEYEKYISDLTKAEESKNLAFARAEVAKGLFEGGRTEEVTRRAALYQR